MLYDTLKYINNVSEPTVMQSDFRQLGDAGYYIGTVNRAYCNCVHCSNPICEPVHDYTLNRMTEYMDKDTAETALARYLNGDDTFPIEIRT